MKLRTYISFASASHAVNSLAVSLPTPDGFAIRVNSVQYFTDAPIATLGLSEMFLAVSSKSVTQLGISSFTSVVIRDHNSVLFVDNIVDASPGQAAAKNLAPNPSGYLLPVTSPDDALIAGSTFYILWGQASVKATGPTVNAAMVVDYDFVKITATNAVTLSAQY